MEKFGIPPGEWDRLGSVYVLRSCVLKPCLTGSTTCEEYWRSFLGAMERAIGAVRRRS